MRVKYQGEIWECVSETEYSLDLILKSQCARFISIKICKDQDVKWVFIDEIYTV